MDEYRENVKKVQKAMNQDAAFIQPNPYLAQRVLNAANVERIGKDGIVVKRKIPITLVIVIMIMLSSIVALAATLMSQHIEKAMDIAQSNGAFSNWTADDKIALVTTMYAEGIPMPEELLNIITSTSSSMTEKNDAATKILVDIYGDEAQISHFTIASHDWGDPFSWTLEQKEWFWETLRAKGLYTGKIKYILPGENDLTRNQVVQLAKKVIQDAYALSADAVQEYDADVTFFTIVGTDIAPRWRVYLGHAGADAADYTVLLTRDGQVTEDATLYIFKPEMLAAQDTQSSSPASTVVTPCQKRMSAAEVLYLSAENRQYHFLPECPSVPSEELSAITSIDGYQPCPYCVLQTQLWSAEDKIIYGVMYGELPSEHVIPASQAEQIARDYLRSCGMDSIEELIPYSRYIKVDNHYQYTVFFARLEGGQIEPIYSVMIDAESGEILKELKSPENGKG